MGRPRQMTPGKTAGFQIGLFGPNASSGMAPTLVPERGRAGWDDNVRLARLADRSGIDFLLPIARWRGYGGDPIVGDPEQVAALLNRIRGLGIEGIALSFVNYLDELPFFVEEVLPRLGDPTDS